MRRVLTAKEKVAAARQRYAVRTGRNTGADVTRTEPNGPRIELGKVDGKPVTMPIAALTRHMHVIGTTSAGKSNFLEVTIRQLISKGYGVCILDPHGGHPDGLYTKTLHWLADTGLGNVLADTGQLHLIDPNVTSHVTGFNPLTRPDANTSLSVVAGTMLGAMERVWDDENSHSKPTIRRVLKGTFHALAEMGLTLAETDLIFNDPHDSSGIREQILSRLNDPYAISVIERIHRLGTENRSSKEFDAETIGPINRIAEFLSTDAIRLMVGQTENLLDFPAVLDGGHVVLANLQEGDQVGSDETNLLGRMLLHAMFFHSKRRKKTDKPFFLIIDECHRFLSGDIAHILSESRKFGLGLLLGHQYLTQIREAGDSIHHAIRNNCATKLVFRIEDTEEAAELANAVIPLDLEMPVKALIKPSAIGQEIIKLTGKGSSKSFVTSVTKALAEAVSNTHGESSSFGEGTVTGEFAGEVMTPGDGWSGIGDVLSQSTGASTTASSIATQGTIDAVTKSVAKSISHGIANGTAVSETVTEALATVYKDLPGAVHSKDNVLYMAARALRGLKTGSAFVSHGTLANIIDVPLAPRIKTSKKALEQLRIRAFETSSASLPIDNAQTQINARVKKLQGEAFAIEDDLGEPASFREPAPKTRRSGRDGILEE